VAELEKRERISFINLLHTGNKTAALTLMVLPGAIWLVLLRYLPMFGIVLAFKDYKLPNARYINEHGFIQDILSRDWVGLNNFTMLLGNPMTGKFIRNTLLYNITFIVLGLVIAVTFAILLSELTHKKSAKVYQTFMFFPYFISWVVVSYFLWAFLDTKYGLIDPAIFGLNNFYQQSAPWPYIIILSNVWKMTGYSTILYLAAITGIDPTQYEAASVDGASKWKQILHVTLPHLRTIIIILFIMNVGRIFNSDFGQFWALPQNGGMGQVVNATETIDTFVYRMLDQSVNIGQSTAVGLFQNVIGFICIITANTIVRKVDPESALF
jgi:putative aldouronate transport system permease protein